MTIASSAPLGAAAPRAPSPVQAHRVSPDAARWVAACCALTFVSGFGQTFFVALFSTDLRAAYGLSQAGFGAVYAAATLSSALALVWVGQLADSAKPRLTAAGLVLALALTAALMAVAPSLAPGGLAGWALLTACVFGLRLFGQGMMGHTAATLTAKRFSASRGRALAMVALGMPLAEAVMPSAAIALREAAGWRSAWFAAAAFAALVVAPAVAWLLREGPSAARAASSPSAAVGGLTRGQALRTPHFYGLVAGLLTTGFSFTGVFFTQTELAAQKGWPLDLWAAAFAGYAATSVLGSLLSGWAVDRLGARNLAKVMLLPACLSLALLAWFEAPWVAFAFLALGGLSTGANVTVTGALWAEVYGTRHLGSIRAVIAAAMVFSTALAPPLMGALIDSGVPMDLQIAGLAAVVLAGQAVLALTVTRLRPFPG